MATRIDALLANHGNLREAVEALLEGCKGSEAGTEALAKWGSLLMAEVSEGGTPEEKAAPAGTSARKVEIPSTSVYSSLVLKERGSSNPGGDGLGHLVLFMGNGPLWLTGVKRKNGIVSSAYVENGNWDLVLKEDGVYHAMSYGTSQNSWVPKEYTEVRVTREMMKHLGNRYNYNDVCGIAKGLYKEHRKRNP
jgi:hypothetical protein